MNKPSWFNKKIISIKHEIVVMFDIARKSNLIFFIAALSFFFLLTNLWDEQTTSYAHAYSGNLVKEKSGSTILFQKDSNLFENRAGLEKQSSESNKKESGTDVAGKDKKSESLKKIVHTANDEKSTNKAVLFEKQSSFNEETVSIAGLNIKKIVSQSDAERQLSEKLYEIMGDTPIKEMVPFISKRDERVAAFLVGIAKKESSFGLASPSKDGETCYNYWGYKGAGGRGVGMGYACFASAEEAIQVVGDRIEVLVNKQRNTPARMVDTWKCGTSCKGDPGAASWVATVALYFEKILG